MEGSGKLRSAGIQTPDDAARFATLVATAVDGIMVIDASGVVQVYSPACARLFGYPAEEVLGHNVKKLMPSPYHEQHDGYLAHYRHTGEKRIIGIGREVVGRRKDGTTFPMYLSVGEGSVGDQAMYIGIVHDLTDQQRAERRLQQLQAELLHVSRLSEIGQMASALAHELNQPLTSIANFARAAEKYVSKIDAREAQAARKSLDVIAEQAVRAGDIIRRIREFVSRGDTERSVEGIGAIVDEAITLSASVTKLHRIRLTRPTQSNGLAVLADRIQIQQVLMNLIKNAAEAMADQKDAEIAIDALPHETLVEISVRDNGPGLTPEIAERLFEPFHSTKAEGMGVGLSICRTIIESHGGRLWATSNQSGGTTFRFTLTRVTGHDESAAN